MKRIFRPFKTLLASALIGLPTLAMAADIATIAAAASAADSGARVPTTASATAPTLSAPKSGVPPRGIAAPLTPDQRKAAQQPIPVDLAINLDVAGPLKVTQRDGKPLPASFNWRYDTRKRANGEPYGFVKKTYRIVFRGNKSLAKTGIYARVVATPFQHRDTQATIPVQIRIGPDVVAESGKRSEVVHLPVTDPYASKSGIERTALYFTVMAPASTAWALGDYAGKVTMQFSQRAADLARQP